MPQLTDKLLSDLFAWIVDAQELLPLSEGAKTAVEALIEQQEALQKSEPASAKDDPPPQLL